MFVATFVGLNVWFTKLLATEEIIIENTRRVYKALLIFGGPIEY